VKLLIWSATSLKFVHLALRSKRLDTPGLSHMCSCALNGTTTTTANGGIQKTFYELSKPDSHKIAACFKQLAYTKLKHNCLKSGSLY